MDNFTLLMHHIMYSIVSVRLADLEFLHSAFSQSFLAPKYALYDGNGSIVFRIEGPVCICQGICCTQDVEFNVSNQVYNTGT